MNIQASTPYITTCVSSVTQHTFNLIRGTQEEQHWFVEQQELYRKKRDLVHDALASLRPLYGGEGAFYWLFKLTDEDLEGKTDLDWVQKVVKEHQLLTIPGSAFGQQSTGYIRISYGPRLPQLQEGLERLQKALR